MSADPNESTGNGHAAPTLSAKALACQQALRAAADGYTRIVARVIDDPRGPFIAELREAEERVGEAAASYALAFAEGERDQTPDD